MFFDARSSNNHRKKLIAMLMSVALTQYIGGAQDDFYRLTAELEKTIERSKTDRQDFKNSCYTVLHFSGVKPAQEHKIISLCSSACLCTHPESNLSIIQIKKRISCNKQPKEQISDVILGLRSFVNHNIEREIFTADHQLSVHEIAVKNLHGFLTINDLVNRRVNCENLVHYIYINSIKKALNESIDMLFKTILKEELQAYTMYLSNSKLHQKSFATQDLAKDIKGIYKAIMIRFKAVETSKSWSLLFRKTYETYVVDCNSSLVAKLGLYKEHDQNMISSINNHLMIYTKLYKMRTLRFIERSIMPVIWQKFIKQADDEDNMAFVKSFYLIVNNIAECYKILPSGENTFETIFEESTKQIDQSIINYFGAIGFTKCLDKYKHANYSNNGYQINPIYMFNSIQIVCSGKITIENFSLLAHILSTVEKIFDDEKNHVIFIDMQKTINQDSFISGFYIPYLKKLSVTQPPRLTNKVLAEKLTIMTKSAGHSFATCSIFSLYNIQLRLYCSEEAKTLYNTRQSFPQHFSVAERVKIYPQLIKISCKYQQWDGQPLYGLNKEHYMESRNDIRLHLYNDKGDYDILIKPNFSSSGVVESLNVSHNLPHPILTNEENYRFKPKLTTEGIKYNNVPSQDFLIALNLYLQTMMQIPEFIEISALCHNGLNSSYHEQVQIPGLSKSISTYTDISTNTLDSLNNKYCKTTISGKSILNPCLKLKYKDVLDRFLDENAWAQKIKDFTESYSIDIHKFGYVMDTLIINQKHLNVTSDCGYFNYNCGNREIYIYAINNNNSMTDIYVIRDAIEMDYNNTLPYYYLFVYNICLKDDNISRQIQLLSDALTVDLQIDPITVIFLALLQANYDIYSDLHKQYETLRNNFDIPFYQFTLGILRFYR